MKVHTRFAVPIRGLQKPLFSRGFSHSTFIQGTYASTTHCTVPVASNPKPRVFSRKTALSQSQPRPSSLQAGSYSPHRPYVSDPKTPCFPREIRTSPQFRAEWLFAPSKNPLFSSPKCLQKRPTPQKKFTRLYLPLFPRFLCFAPVPMHAAHCHFRKPTNPLTRKPKRHLECTSGTQHRQIELLRATQRSVICGSSLGS